MFKLRKRVENIEKKLEQKKDNISEITLYDFYLKRRLEEINAKLKNKLDYEIIDEESSTKNNGSLYFPFFRTRTIIIKLDNIKIKKYEKEYNTLSYELPDKYDYELILNYINLKSLNFFIRLDKKLEKLRREQKDIDNKYNNQKINIEKEIRKLAN